MTVDAAPTHTGREQPDAPNGRPAGPERPRSSAGPAGAGGPEDALAAAGRSGASGGSAAPDDAGDGDRPDGRRRLVGLTVLAGAGFVVLVTHDGRWGWALLRAAVVVAATAGLVAAERSGSRRVAGRVAVAVGVPTLAVAVGLVPHALEWSSVVGLVAIVLAVAGVGLVVGGAVVALRGRGPLRATIAGIVLAVGCLLVAFVVSPAVAATNVVRPQIDRTPADVGLDAESVTVPTADGVVLAGWYAPSSNRAAVVVLHGAGSTRSDALDEAVVLADAGFGVLLVDARGHGESTGRAMDFGWWGDADVAAATEFLANRPDVDPGRIGAVGLSMGGEEVIGASGTDERLVAVVAEGATSRVAADDAWLSARYGLRGAFQEQLEWLQDRVTGLLTDAPQPGSLRSAVADSGDVRYLLIAAGEMPDEGHAAAYIASAAPERVEVWEVDGSGHVDGLDTAPEAWTGYVVGFLTSTLLGADAGAAGE